MRRLNYLSIIILIAALLSGCFGGSDQHDLDDFIAETKRRPKGQIEPLPSFQPYESFNYSASQLRNPFEQPVAELESILVGTRENVKPDFDRPKEVLESFNFDSLTMVGTMKSADNTLWVLIDDGAGSVHRIRSGNYLGKNHGRIVSATETQIDVIEIVSDGPDGWVQRPRQIVLAEKD